jgi:hypothetical protein
VASFSGGAVGVISALMLVEVKNVRQQEKKRCTYCHGTGMSDSFLIIWQMREKRQPSESLFLYFICLCELASVL